MIGAAEYSMLGGPLILQLQDRETPSILNPHGAEYLAATRRRTPAFRPGSFEIHS